MKIRSLGWSAVAAVVLFVPVYLWRADATAWTWRAVDGFRAGDGMLGGTRAEFGAQRILGFCIHVFVLMTVQVVVARLRFTGPRAPHGIRWIAATVALWGRCFPWLIVSVVLGMMACAFNNGSLFVPGLIWTTALLTLAAILCARDVAAIPLTVAHGRQPRGLLPDVRSVVVAFAFLQSAFWANMGVEGVVLGFVDLPVAVEDVLLALPRGEVQRAIAMGVGVDVLMALVWAWWAQRPGPAPFEHAAVFE